MISIIPNIHYRKIINYFFFELLTNHWKWNQYFLETFWRPKRVQKKIYSQTSVVSRSCYFEDSKKILTSGSSSGTLPIHVSDRMGQSLFALTVRSKCRCIFLFLVLERYTLHPHGLSCREIEFLEYVQKKSFDIGHIDCVFCYT